MKEALANPKVSKKTWGLHATEGIRHLKKDVLAFKQNLQLKSDEMIIKTTVFDVPAEVWRSGFDSFSMGAGSTAQVITFKKYNAERSNTEFVRDFNLACAVQPHLTLLNSKTGDQIHVNKGFFD